jgi:hypothetical protein
MGSWEELGGDGRGWELGEGLVRDARMRRRKGGILCLKM